MGKYKQVQFKSTLEDCLDLSEVEELRDDMQSWVDNMGDTALANTNKYSMAEEAVEALGKFDEIDFSAILDLLTDDQKKQEITYTAMVPKARRQSTSRAMRLSNATGKVQSALSWLDSQLVDQNPEKYADLKEEMNSLEGDLSDLENVEFPGMFS
jgi:hypothetical protein